MHNPSKFFFRLNIVKSIPVFGQLNWFDLQKITRKAILQDYKKGDSICHEGGDPDFFYCLVTGRLQKYRRDSGGSKQDVDFIHRGTHFGIIALLTGESHAHTYEALNNSVILKVAKDDFHAILKTMPQLGLAFSHSLSKTISKSAKGSAESQQSTIISVYSSVCGIGSSTYALNLATSLIEETKKNAVLINIHPISRKNDQNDTAIEEAAPVWKCPPNNFNDISSEHDKVLASLCPQKDGADLLHLVFNPADTMVSQQIGPLISALVGNYRYVVVDLPNDMDDIISEALTQSDEVHLLTTERKKDLELTRKVIDHLEMNLRDNFHEEQIRVLIKPQHAKVFLSFEEIDQFIDYSVYAHLPMIQTEDLMAVTENEHLSYCRCSEVSEYARTVRRIAREIGGARIGLVLGGGAALGIAHVGVIRVLEQENIPVDMVVGSSMGALVASLWVTGKDSLGLEQVAREFQSGWNMMKLFDPPFIPISGLIRGKAIRRWLAKHLGKRTFYSTDIPLKIVGYDIQRRQESVYNSGGLVEAVRKSIAIPGVIRPVLDKEQVIIDGGVLNPLPTNVLKDLGINKIIAVNVLQSPDDVAKGYDLHQLAEAEKGKVSFLRSPFRYLQNRVSKGFAKPFQPNIADIIIQTLQATEYVIAEQSSQLADVVIHPDLVGINWYELYRVDDLIAQGEAATRKALPEIKALMAAQ